MLSQSAYKCTRCHPHYGDVVLYFDSSYRETKSVTIWFQVSPCLLTYHYPCSRLVQNKRQTDRKVALNNATSSRNLIAALFQNPAPNITITTPTSPSYPLEIHRAESKTGESDTSHRPYTARSHPVKRTASYSSISSTSTSSSTRTRPSLDRVAARSEIRFRERAPLFRTMSQPASSRPHTLPPRIGPVTSSSNADYYPVSSPHELWSNMPSSPMAPSSPPPPEILEYARTRKSKSLDWVCTVAHLTGKEEARSFSPMQRKLVNEALETATRERDYEEGTALTEDESELVTPQNSQDVPMSWTPDDHLKKDVSFIRFTSQSFRDIPKGRLGWQEDEMHAALALCGLRG